MGNVSAQAADVTLAWDANQAKNLAGYKIYYTIDGAGSGFTGQGADQGDSGFEIFLSDLPDPRHPQFTLTGLKDATEYVFVVTAFDRLNNESDFSNELSFYTGKKTKLITNNTNIAKDQNGVQDTDADGMPDNWEVLYGLNPRSDDAKLDLDGDGIPNIQEYDNGSDPALPDNNWSIVIDDGQPGTSSTGQWFKSGGLNPYGSSSRYAKADGATYLFESALSGRHEIALWWSEYASRCTEVPVALYDGKVLLDTIYVNQRKSAGQWNSLGTFDFSDRAKILVISDNSGCSTSADAVEITAVGSTPAIDKKRKQIIMDNGDDGTSFTGKWKKSGGKNPFGASSVYSKTIGATYLFESSLSGPYKVELWWSAHSSRCTNVPIEIYDGERLLDTIQVNQRQNAGQWHRVGTYNFTRNVKVVVVSEDSNCSTSADALRLSN
ncbi:MAG: hypothetical protein HKM93_11450 [Desulfobacteraceae bacterium]|nr:hypothetical protein [Desulfobacteraceae bacterium]